MPRFDRRPIVSAVLVLALVGVPAVGISAVRADDAQQAPRSDRPSTTSSGLLVKEVHRTLPEAIALPKVDARTKTTLSSTTYLSDGFEGAFPGGSWAVGAQAGKASVYWGKSAYRKSSGTYSIWCAAAGSAAPGGGQDVPVNTEAWAIAGPFDLSSVTSGTLSFDLWLETEQDYDYFQWLFSLDGQNFSGLQTSTSTGWTTVNQDLTAWGTGNDVTAHSQVWIAFVYTSDGSNTYEGAYVDQVVLSGDGGGGGSSCGTYVITSDNDNNTSSGTADGDWNTCIYNEDPKHPIEFHIDVDQSSIQTAQLLLLCNDVDQYTEPSNPEIDKVYINDQYLGDLTGADGEDSTTLFTVPAGALHTGRNQVEILVNQNPGSEPDDWCVELKQAQLIVNGGCTGTASCRSVTTNRASYSPGDTVAVTYEVDTSAGSQQVRVETDILDPSGAIVAGSDQVYTTSGTTNDPKTVNLTLPGGAAAGTYTAKVFVFDASSGALESSCNSTFTVTGGGGGCTLTCSASVPSTTTVGVPVQFIGSATATGCSESPQYFWYPDTDTTATVFQQSFTNTYDEAGSHNWQLVVIADDQRCERNGTITVTSGGGGGSSVVWVPVGSRASGANNSIWRTDLGILNSNSVAVTVTITIYTNGGPVSGTVTLPAFGQRVMTDVVGWLVPGSSMSGAISVSSTRTVVITSRTYNAFSAGAVCFPLGTMGQSLDGLAVASGLSSGQSGWLPHMIENSRFRSNIGYTNTGTTTATLTVRLYNASGAQVGSYTETLTPGKWKQKQQPFRNVAGLTNMAAGSAKITVNSGSGVVAYGSVVDNVTNDPTTIILRR